MGINCELPFSSRDCPFWTTVEAFEIMLQLFESANLIPSEIETNTCILTSYNCLNYQGLCLFGLLSYLHLQKDLAACHFCPILLLVFSDVGEPEEIAS